MQLIRQRMERYCDILPEGNFNGVQYDLAALYRSRENQTVLFKENIVDYAESQELCLVRCCSSSDEAMQLMSSSSECVHSLIPSPDRHHKSTTVLLVIVLSCPVPLGLRSAIKKFKWSKLFRFGFFGWAVVKIVCVSLADSHICSNNAGRGIKKLFVPDFVSGKNASEKIRSEK